MPFFIFPFLQVPECSSCSVDTASVVATSHGPIAATRPAAIAADAPLEWIGGETMFVNLTLFDGFGSKASLFDRTVALVFHRCFVSFSRP